MAVFTKSGIPSPVSVPLRDTDRQNTQRAAAAGDCGDFCSLGAGGWTPTATAAAALRMAWIGGGATFGAGESITIFNPGVRVRYAALTGSGIAPGTLFYLDAGAAGKLNTTANGAPLARACANAKGVFEGVIELL